MKKTKRFAPGDSVWVCRDGEVAEWLIESAFTKSGHSGATKEETVSYWAYRVGADKSLDSSSGTLLLTEALATEKSAISNRCKQIDKAVRKLKLERYTLTCVVKE